MSEELYVEIGKGKCSECNYECNTLEEYLCGICYESENDILCVKCEDRRKKMYASPGNL